MFMQLPNGQLFRWMEKDRYAEGFLCVANFILNFPGTFSPMPVPSKSGSSEISPFQSALVSVCMQETARRDYSSREEGGGMFRFEHLCSLISHCIFHLPGVGSKPLDGNIRFADGKGAPI